MLERGDRLAERLALLGVGQRALERGAGGGDPGDGDRQPLLGQVGDQLQEPSPSSPSRFSTGTRTSVKNSSAVSWACMPILSRLRPRSKPSMPRSSTSSDMPRWRWRGSVLTAVMTRSALIPLVMNVFEPLTT